jgi:hypothetical protein
MSTNGMGVRLDFDGEPTADSAQKIRRLEDIPNIRTMVVPDIDYLVPDLIARGTISLWAGVGGGGKSFVAQSLALAVATGGTFLGRKCQQTPVLYLDYENPAFSVRDRLDLMGGERSTPNLYVWGTWLQEQPPQIGNELLLAISKQSKPLIIVDPLRFAHGLDENDSTVMVEVMLRLRDCKAVGATVIILHHLAKAEGSTFRGSTAIRDHSDIAFVQELSEQTGLITLKGNKNRFGEPVQVTIKPNFEEGTFEVTDSPQFTRRQDELEKLKQIISDNPGLSQNEIHKRAGMMKKRLVRLLKENAGTMWSTTVGPYKATLYHPIDVVLGFPEQLRTTEQLGEQVVGCSGCSPLKGREQQNNYSQEPVPGCSSPREKSLPQCPACHGYDLYREPSGKMVCQTCQTMTEPVILKPTAINGHPVSNVLVKFSSCIDAQAMLEPEEEHKRHGHAKDNPRPTARTGTAPG